MKKSIRLVGLISSICLLGLVVFAAKPPDIKMASLTFTKSNLKETPVLDRPFITTWKTDNSGTSNSTSITIPTTGTGYSYDVDWNNDGTYDQFGITGNTTHDYGTAGTYTVAIRGDFPRIYFNSGGDRQKIRSVDQWGDIVWASMEKAFSGCSQFNVLATDSPNLAGATNMSYMFSNCSINANINGWDVSTITKMEGLFSVASSFNQPLDSWNVGAVTNMDYMFRAANSFNQPLNSWNVSSVTTMASMFFGARNFNQNLNLWNVSSVIEMSGMFQDAYVFNGNIRSWNVSSLTSMGSMFASAKVFNQDIGGWNVSSVSALFATFQGAISFNQDISGWNVSGMTFIVNTFYGATSFNQDISSWDVSSVTNMGGLFLDATAFNQNLGAWNIAASTNMFGIFTNASMSIANYDATLIGWDAAGYTSKNLGSAAPLQYCAAQSARTNLITNKGWTITGDTYVGTCPVPMITMQPQSKSVCGTNPAVFSVTTTNASAYQWQVKVGAGAFTNLNNGGIYSDVTTASLHINNTFGLVGNQYRCVASNTNDTVTSAAATLTATPVSLTLTSPTNNISGDAGTHKATETITATNLISATGKAVYETGKSVALNPGFSTVNGAVFRAQVNQNICQ